MKKSQEYKQGFQDGVSDTEARVRGEVAGVLEGMKLEKSIGQIKPRPQHRYQAYNQALSDAQEKIKNG